SFLFDLSRTCKSVYMFDEYCDEGCDNVSLDAIQKLCKDMMEGATKLRSLAMGLPKNRCIKFLKLVEITYRDGWLYSDRNIEAYKVIVLLDEEEEEEDYGSNHGNIFNGNIEIRLFMKVDDGDVFNTIVLISILIYDTPESLEKAKAVDEYHVRIDLPSN
ncbi:hypothetical protein PENTCL1PPCAC_3498, partial [Pristionchus entomophagus]